MITIKELRAKTGLSQQKFGDLLEIPKRTIQDWEQDKRTPPPYVVELIAFRIEHDKRFTIK